MTFETNSRGRVDILRNRAVARAKAGLGFLHSKSTIQEINARETMSNSDDTRFEDTILIVGKPQWSIPVGIATFFCDVEGDFKQPLSGSNTVGNGEAFASFFARETTSQLDQQSWSFPTMDGPGLNSPINRVLKVSILFWIGARIEMRSELNSRSTEFSIEPIADDLDSNIEIKTTLRPIKVVGVDNPVAITVTDSGTKYYTESESGSIDISLRQIALSLRHH